MFNELKHLAHHLLSWLVFLFTLAIFFFSFGLSSIIVFGNSLLVPLPTATHSFAAQVFEKIKTDMVPAGVEIVVLNPFSAFISQVKVAFFLAFLAAFPFLLLQIIKYLRPALFAHERKESLKLLLPTVILFISGCVFSYYVIIPPTFAVLYRYASAIGATSYFAVNELISLVFALTFVTGILFLLPVGMFLLNKTGVVSSDFWRKQWKTALFSFLVVSAIITPDGSGISMLLLTTPLIALYGLGTIISK